jgi:hypothetical protein
MNTVKTCGRLAMVAALATAMTTPPAGQAKAAMVVVPVASSGAGGMWGAGGIVGIATFLGIYDLFRRTSCSGDVLKLGGPGFGEAIRPSDNVLVPRRCPTR